MDILLNKEKYILAYIDYTNENIEIINYTVECLNTKCIIIKSNNETTLFNNNMIIEIIPDNLLESELLNNCLFIIYLSNFKRSNIINVFLTNNFKIILHEINSMNENLLYIKNDNDLLLNNSNRDKDIINKFLNIYSNLNDLTNNNSYDKNIKLNINKIINDNEKIFAVTVFNNDNNILKVIQLKCIVENLNNTNISKIIVIGDNLDEVLKEILDKFPEKIIIHNKNGKVSYKDILDVISLRIKSNSLVCLLMGDIIIPNQESLNNLNIDIGLNDKTDKSIVYSISRLDRVFNGNIIKSDKLGSSLFSTEQDVWFFFTPLELNQESMNKLENIYFYDYLSNLYFNNEIKENNYILINNTKNYKIIRFMLDNQIYNRPLIDKNLNNSLSKNFDNIYLLPSNEILDNITLEQLIKLINLNDNENYLIKCELFNKYLKNKIINNI
jgi:hypothetical protein